MNYKKRLENLKQAIDNAIQIGEDCINSQKFEGEKMLGDLEELLTQALDEIVEILDP